MQKGLLFDFNGTMFFDSPKHKEAWNAFSLTYRNRPILDEELDHMHGQTNKKIIEMLLKKSLNDEESETLSRAKEAFYRECCLQDPAGFHLVEGLEEVLDELKRRQIPMTICSASIKDNMDFFISSFRLDRWFHIDHIVYDDGLHINKISMFQDGAKRIGVLPKDCMVIEDSLSGIDFARRTGVGRIVAITTPEKVSEYQRLSGIDAIIQNYNNFDFSFFK